METKLTDHRKYNRKYRGQAETEMRVGCYAAVFGFQLMAVLPAIWCSIWRDSVIWSSGITFCNTFRQRVACIPDTRMAMEGTAVMGLAGEAILAVGEEADLAAYFHSLYFVSTSFTWLSSCFLFVVFLDAWNVYKDELIHFRNLTF